MSIPLAYFFWKTVMGQERISWLQILSLYLILCVGADDLFVFSDTWKVRGPHACVYLPTYFPTSLSIWRMTPLGILPHVAGLSREAGPHLREHRDALRVDVPARGGHDALDDSHHGHLPLRHRHRARRAAAGVWHLLRTRHRRRLRAGVCGLHAGLSLSLLAYLSHLATSTNGR